MIPIVEEKIEEYLHGLTPRRDRVLEEMEEVARKREIPIVGPLVGRFLYQLVKISGARRIFELGSAIGYSTIWLARGLKSGGEVYFTDMSRKNAREALKFFQEAGVDSVIAIKTGEALTILKETPGEFDLIFNDVDKGQYPEVFRQAIPRLRRGGMLVSDNVLWSGQVAREGGDEWTRRIKEFNHLLYTTPGLHSTIIPLRDGVSVTIKEES